jgi:hypothetical protein
VCGANWMMHGAWQPADGFDEVQMFGGGYTMLEEAPELRLSPPKPSKSIAQSMMPAKFRLW